MIEQREETKMGSMREGGAREREMKEEKEKGRRLLSAECIMLI